MSTPKFLEDFVTLEDFAAEIKRNPKTPKRWSEQPDGLPLTWLGKTPMVHIPTAQQWLLSRMKRPNPRRKSAASA
jgi:hypothetical protein